MALRTQSQSLVVAVVPHEPCAAPFTQLSSSGQPAMAPDTSAVSAPRTAEVTSLVEVVVSAHNPIRPTRQSLSLTHAEYEAQTLQSPPSPTQNVRTKSTSDLTAVLTSEPSAVSTSLPPAEPRHLTYRLQSQSPSRISAPTAYSSTTVMAEHSSPKLNKSRSRKRRAELASPFI